MGGFPYVFAFSRSNVNKKPFPPTSAWESFSPRKIEQFRCHAGGFAASHCHGITYRKDPKEGDLLDLYINVGLDETSYRNVTYFERGDISDLAC